MKKQFPILEVKGTHQDIGYAIGTRFKKEIQNRIYLRKKLIPNYSQYLEQCAPYYSATKQYLPKLIEELNAMASASSIPIEDLFFHNCREVYNFFNSLNDNENDDHCTAVISHLNEGLIIGHNEDWDPKAIDDLYILSATVNNTKIFALANNTIIPGDSVMMNSYGLVQCINELNSKSHLGIPKNFIARAIMESKNIDDAINIVNNNPRASGFNHVLAQNKDIVNIEITGPDTEVMRVNEKTFVHTNHYLSSKLSQHEKYHTKSSEKRFQKATEILKNDLSPKNTTLKEMFRLLSDTSSGSLSICNQNTIASIVFVPKQNEIWVCYGRPDLGEYIRYEL